MALKRKAYSGAASTGDLGDRQVRVVISTPEVDRVGDVVVQAGIDLATYKANPIVLWNHDPNCPIARCVEIGMVEDRLEALVEFPPAGVVVAADEKYALIKAGIINAASIGFNPVSVEPNKGSTGVRVTKCDLWEFSFVSIPANAGALVSERDAPKMTTKGLYEVSYLADMLRTLGYLSSVVEDEADREGDGSQVPAMLMAALRQLGAALIAMTAEEVAELLGEDLGGDSDDGTVKGMTRKAIVALTKAGRVLSSANEDEIRGSMGLLTDASTKLKGVLDQVCQGDAAESTDPQETKGAKALRVRTLELLRLKAA